MQSGWTKFQFQKRIEELEEELIAEKMVKKNEKQYNEQLRVEIEKRDLHIQALNKINDHFSDIIAKSSLVLGSDGWQPINDNADRRSALAFFCFSVNLAYCVSSPPSA